MHSSHSESFSTPLKVRFWTSIFTQQRLVSDTLSKSHLIHTKSEFTENSLIHHVHFILSKFPVIETCIKQFQLETKHDPILQPVIAYATHQWPEKHLIHADLQPYYNHHSDITFCKGILLKMNGSQYPLLFQLKWNHLPTRNWKLQRK